MFHAVRPALRPALRLEFFASSAGVAAVSSIEGASRWNSVALEAEVVALGRLPASVWDRYYCSIVFNLD